MTIAANLPRGTASSPKSISVAFSFLAILLAAAPAAGQFPVEKARALIGAYSRIGEANGAVLVAQKGKILFEEGYGFKDFASNQLNDDHSIFQIGSVTKQFTSAVILRLQAAGKLSVDDRLSKYFPGLPHADSIMLKHLLTHTSGLYNYTRDGDFMQHRATIPQSREQMMALFKDKPLGFAPGTQWEYSNTNYMLLGYVIEMVTGKTYEQTVRESVLMPLAMGSSGFDFAHLQSPYKATGYSHLGDHPEPAPIVDSTASYAAGALYSTVEDLYKWDRALYTSSVLTPEERREAFTPVMNHYGYGWLIDSMYGRPILTHGGGIFGFTSSILRFPGDETVIILLDNSGSSHLDEIQRKLAAIVFGQPYSLPEELKEVSVDDSTLRSYTGEYEIKPGFVLTITLDGHALLAQATGQGKVQLHAQTQKMFFVKEFEAKIEFAGNAEGKAERIVLHQGDKETVAKRVP